MLIFHPAVVYLIAGMKKIHKYSSSLYDLDCFAFEKVTLVKFIEICFTLKLKGFLDPFPRGQLGQVVKADNKPFKLKR